MSIGTLFFIIVWEEKRYPVSHKHRNTEYFTLAQNIIVKVTGVIDRHPPQLVVIKIDSSELPEGITPIRLRHS